MALLVPALLTNRPEAFIDPHRQAEYPILLGDSLRDTSGTKSQFFNVQYNWKAKNLSSRQQAVITKTDPQSSGNAVYQLTIQDPAAESKPFRYTGHLRAVPGQNGSSKSFPEDQTTSLALVFNQEKSAFILEKVSASLNFNLTSGPGQSRADIQAHPQLYPSKKSDERLSTEQKPTGCSSDDDEEPDPTNPYDYRHFLDEARTAAEKGLGSRTPIPGSLSGFPSPVPGPSRFRASSGPGTPLHKPTSLSSEEVRKRKISDESTRDTERSSTGASLTKNPTTKPRPRPRTSTSLTTTTSLSSSSKPKPLSKERITDSDEEIGDTITLSRPSTGKSTTRTKKPPPPNKSGYAPSPRIEVDEAADLVIDMGSPPPAARRRPGAGFASPFAIAKTQPSLRNRKSAAVHGTSILDSEDEGDEEEEDAEGEPDDDLDAMMRDVNVDVGVRRSGMDRDVDVDMDLDGDVEDLVLGSPRASTTRAPSVSVSRVDCGGDGAQDEDEDDELAAELEAALENDDEDGDEDGDGSGNGGGVGLGISTSVGAGGAGADDESEVSEEE